MIEFEYIRLRLIGEDMETTTALSDMQRQRAIKFLAKIRMDTADSPVAKIAEYLGYNSPELWWIFSIVVRGFDKKFCRLAADSPKPLTVLCGLFLLAAQEEQFSWRLQALPVFVSKKMILGLASNYPDFVLSSFTLGLDEVVLNPSKSLDNVVNLLLLQ